MPPAVGVGGRVRLIAIAVVLVARLSPRNTARGASDAFAPTLGPDGLRVTPLPAVPATAAAAAATTETPRRLLDCPAGQFDDGSACTDCPAGTYSSASASSCTDCFFGKYTATSGATSCISCSAGRYGPGEGLTACDA